MPRIVSRQNQPANFCEEYFRRSIYLPVLDNILTDLEERLSPEVINLFSLQVVLPKTYNTPENKVALKKIVDAFQDIMKTS
ncbi:unnamed protein product [Diabrotica balteata]|uniref:Uncharacterized protein n=1 Tax=Diabrotica balteata TaxID=107213 RepID=A0A9N9SY05_DIABA|nr:unnamed protein product [Diabrotica balteata]